MESKSRNGDNDPSLSLRPEDEMQWDLNLTSGLSPALSHGLSNTTETTTTPPDGGLVAWMAGKYVIH
jgi:hypothetical protein